MKKKHNSKADWRRKKRRRALTVAPPKLAHETMLELVPGLERAANAVVSSRKSNPQDAPVLLAEADLGHPVVEEFLSLHGSYLTAQGWTRESSLIELEQLCCHLSNAVDFEIAGRKAFWVSPELSEQLSNTTLDIGGDLLNLPFPACAFIFRDDLALSLAGALMAHSFERAAPRSITVYARRIPAEFNEDGVRFTFLFDGFDGEWPYMLQRDIPTEGVEHLAGILDSHPETSDDPIFRSEELNSLVKLAINAVLYTTSDAFGSEHRAAASRRDRQVVGTLSGEDVMYLPGRIPIGERQTKNSGDRTGKTVEKRFWVRGHWRRPNPSWTDQRLRWVKPYLKGPDMAAIVQKDYELVGRSSSPSEDSTPDQPQ